MDFLNGLTVEQAYALGYEHGFSEATTVEPESEPVKSATIPNNTVLHNGEDAWYQLEVGDMMVGLGSGRWMKVDSPQPNTHTYRLAERNGNDLRDWKWSHIS